MRQCPNGAPRCRSGGESGSACGVEGHRVAQSLQFLDMVPNSTLRVGAPVVVVRAEIEVARVLVGEQRPDDHENGPADRDDGALPAPTSGDAPVALAEEGVRAAGTDGGLAEERAR
jgi:hypothetical protein